MPPSHKTILYYVKGKSFSPVSMLYSLIQMDNASLGLDASEVCGSLKSQMTAKAVVIDKINMKG